MDWVPEFAARARRWDDLPFVVLGNFGLFIRELLQEVSKNDELLRRCFRFVELMVESKDERVVNLAAVGVLELLVDEETDRAITMEFLGEAARALATEVIASWPTA